MLGLSAVSVRVHLRSVSSELLKHTQLVFQWRPSVKRTDRLTSVRFLRHFLLIFLGVPCTHHLVSSAHWTLFTSLTLNPFLVVKPFVGTD